MTNQEAVNVINSLIQQCTSREQPTAVEGLNIAKDALEKQIPKQVTDDRCPSCNRDIVGSGFYCWNCGQRLSWITKRWEKND